MSLLANAWTGSGVDVSLVTIGPTSGDTYYLDPGVERVGLDLLMPSTGRVSAVLNNFRRVRKLRAVIRKLRPDVLVSFMTSTNALTVLAARSSGVPVIVSERTLPEADRMRVAWRYLRDYAYERAAAVVVQTTRTADWLKKEFPAANIAIIGNPIHVESQNAPDMAAEKALSWSRGCKLVLAAGRLSQEKGLDLLIRAFAPLARSRPTWMLAIFGEGPERSALNRLCQELDISDRVLMPGFSRTLHLVMRRAQLFVLSSRHEGMPNALAEAMACGTPCISFDCPTGPAELISHGHNGLLVPEEDISGLTGALERLMQDDGLRESLGNAAHQSSKAYSMDNVLNGWNALLARTVKATDRGRIREGGGDSADQRT